MPWRKTDVLEQRRLFIARWLMEEESFSELCDEFGIPRKTGYKWRKRYMEQGYKGLEDMSRRPKKFRDQTPNEVLCEILRIKKWKEHWGGRKIRDYLKGQRSFDSLPHSRTIERYLKKCGYVTPRAVTWRGTYASEDLIEPNEVNDVWTADFKGWWRTKNNRRCEPLTVMDRYSRALLNLSAHESATFEATRERFSAVFNEFGLPRIIRMDNGSPFAAIRAMHRLSRFGVWLLKLGILPNRMDPASPNQNGRHERFHRDIKRELQGDPAEDRETEQKRFDVWREEFNFLRPHEALNGDTPMQHYKKSPRRFVENTAFEYPADFSLRKVSDNGGFYWKNTNVQFTYSMAGEYIGIEDTGDEDLKVWFYDWCLGTLKRDGERFCPSQTLQRGSLGRRITI